MKTVSVSVALADGRLRIRAEHDLGPETRVASATAAAPPDELIDDLLRPVRSGHGSAARLGRLLGELLFAGDVGGLLRGALAKGEPVILLSTDERQADWPWELASDPETGARPALDGGGMARIGGRPWSGPGVLPRGVLAIPTLAGGPRRDAVLASTRRLARKTELDIFPADPVTGPGLRRVLEHGAALVHIEGVGPGARILLDDGPVPADRLGVDNRCWLVVLDGTETNVDSGRTLREAGAAMVLAHQVELRPHQTAAIDRELYRALAEGAPVIEALARVRQALAATEGDKSGAWAAPVLWTAPGDDNPVSLVFPPPMTRSPVALGLDGAASSPAQLPYPDLAGPPGHPIPAPVFVHETLRLLQAGDEGAREGRASTMRALAGQLTADPADVRSGTSAMTDKLIDAISRPATPLERPDGFADREARLVEQSAVHPETVRQAAHALLVSPVVCLVAPPGGGGARLARLLTETLFDRHPQMARGADGALLGGPHRAEGGVLTAGGWLYRTVALGWRRDELDPLRPDQPPPRSRVPLVVERPDGKGQTIRRGAWLVVTDGERAPETLAAAAGAVEQGVLQGLNDGGALFRLPVPPDFRLIIVAAHPLEGLPPTVPHIAVRRASDPAVVRARWLAEARHRPGPARDEAGAVARGAMADQLWRVLRVVELVTPVPIDLGSSILRHAIARGGTAEGLDEALQVLLARHLVILSADRFAVLHAGLSGDDAELYRAVGQAARHGDVLPALGLAGMVGERDVATEPEKLAAQVHGWRQRPLELPMAADAAGLLRHLVRQRAL